MSPSTASVNEVLRDLRRTPKHFRAEADGLTDVQLRLQPEPGGWSVHELLAHLRGCADIQGGWIARMLAEDAPTIRYASPRTGMRKTNYGEQDFLTFRRAFDGQRAELVKSLASLDPSAWSRGAMFTGTTPGWTQTVLDVARGLATHEHAHFEQISATASAVR